MLMVILAGIPLFYMELLIGQFSSTGCTGMFRMAPLLKGTGIAQVVVNAYCVCYYSVIISYPIRMISYCFFKKVPWEDCENPWNTDDCVPPNDVSYRASKIISVKVFFLIPQLGKHNHTDGFKTSADEFFQ